MHRHRSWHRATIYEASTLPELQRLFWWESAAQEVFVDLVGEYLDKVVTSSDVCQVQTNFGVNFSFLLWNYWFDYFQDETYPKSIPCGFNARHPGYKPSVLMERISKYSGGSPSCCVAAQPALIYLERFQRRCPAVELTSATFQCLVLVVYMTANKFLEDHSFGHNKSCLSNTMHAPRTTAPKGHKKLQPSITRPHKYSRARSGPSLAGLRKNSMWSSDFRLKRFSNHLWNELYIKRSSVQWWTSSKNQAQMRIELPWRLIHTVWESLTAANFSESITQLIHLWNMQELVSYRQ